MNSEISIVENTVHLCYPIVISASKKYLCALKRYLTAPKKYLCALKRYLTAPKKYLCALKRYLTAPKKYLECRFAP